MPQSIDRTFDWVFGNLLIATAKEVQTIIEAQ